MGDEIHTGIWQNIKHNKTRRSEGGNGTKLNSTNSDKVNIAQGESEREGGGAVYDVVHYVNNIK